MFERFTESARRTLFFARYEASQLGQISIQAEHLLIGVLREDKGVIRRILTRANAAPAAIRSALEQQLPFRQKLSTSVEIPFSTETKHVLQLAAEEADALNHSYIGTEHLLLGLLREETSATAATLIAHGINLRDVRQFVNELGQEPREETPAPIDFDSALVQVGRLEILVSQLAALVEDGPARRNLLMGIATELETLKQRLGR